LHIKTFREFLKRVCRVDAQRMQEDEEPVVRKRKLAAVLQMVSGKARGGGGGSGGGSSGCSPSDAAMPHGWGAGSRGAKDGDARRVDVDLAKTLQAIVDHQLAGLRRSRKVDAAGALAAYDRLRAQSCRPEDIAADVARELARAIAFRADTPNACSTRLGGFGWSVPHIEEHMKRFLEGRIAHLMAALRSSSVPSAQAKDAWTQGLARVQERVLTAGVALGDPDM